MARIRTIKPEFWTDEKIVELSPLARLLFIGSWNYADDHGCLSPSAKQLKLRVIPTAVEDADKLVDELFEMGLFERMQDPSGREFWHIANWSKHQRVNRASDSEYGPETEWRKLSTRGFREDSVSALGSFSEDSVLKGKEGKGREGNGMDIAPQAAQRKPNPIWDTLCDLYGDPSEPQRKLYGRVTAYLARQGADPPEIRHRSALIIEEWGTKAATAASLEKHWSRYDAEVGNVSDSDVTRFKREQKRRAQLEQARQLERGTDDA